MFLIDRNNKVRRYDSQGAIAQARDLATFGSEREMAALAAKWPAARLVLIWNKLPGVSPVRKFTDRKTGVRRIWKAIQEAHAQQAPKVPKGQATKTERVISLLSESGGATLQALMTLTGWQSHSVRGFLSSQLAKKRRLRIQSFKRNGERVYRIRP
jgi:Protein of unknown function (DUF3489)